ncbi:MAG: hypothetical protein RMJ53_03145 [Chitinophagales bacterium]|nr:hypothetical protein [Chitinophagales bacterium]MDW8273207.1 hypothetical protein [Chitinophagales bacterium]
MFTTVAKVGKPHGTRGAFRFYLLFELKSSEFPKSVYLAETQQSQPIPYFVEEIKITEAKQGYLKLEEISSREAAVKLTHAEIMIKTKDFDEFFKQTEDFNYISFKVIDECYGELGIISDAMHSKAHTILSLNYRNHEVMFPLTDVFLIKIDYENKILYTRLPQGIIEAYINTDQ